MQSTRIEQGALLQYAITDKNVLINPGRMLMGHETYPLAIAKNSVI
jgi:glucose-1-phosphate adenylyltransferase